MLWGGQAGAPRRFLAVYPHISHLQLTTLARLALRLAIGRPEIKMSAFVYGTLLAPEVVKTLIKRVPKMVPAHLKGFTRYRVRGEVYPAIVPTKPEDVVQGKVNT